MSFFRACLLALSVFLSVAFSLVQNAHYSQAADTYDYIVIGGGPGGGIVASNLALANQSVLLIEAGIDATADPHTYIGPISYPGPTDVRWAFYVNHTSNATQALRYNHLTWLMPDGSFWVGSGARAPSDAKLLGVYYPRGNTLGGSAVINAMVTILPNDADWDHIANLTGDVSWSSANMRTIFEKIERNHYLPAGTPGHGFSGFMDTKHSDSSTYASTPGRLSVLSTMAAHFNLTGSIFDLLNRDVNFLDNKTMHRDTAQGLFGLPIHTNEVNRRWAPRDVVHSVLAATNSDGTPRYNLTVQIESLATKVLFSSGTNGKPKASGVEFLEGQGVYKATWGYNATSAPKGTLKRAYARKEVIVSGGTFNSPQILQLSGIGEKQHLQSLGINVVIDLPGVGRNLQDNQELTVVGHGVGNFTVPVAPDAVNCTKGAVGDPCLDLWMKSLGPYAGIQGNSELAMLTTDHSSDGNRDILMYMPPSPFRGYYPPTNQTDLGLFTDPPNTAFRNFVRMGVQNNAGYVRIASTDPTDQPEINFQHFQVGADLDIGALEDTIAWVRRVFPDIPAPYGPVIPTEPPCPAGVQANGYCKDRSQDQQWIIDQTFGHHPTSSCAIGKDGDSMAVLDSKFRVRGVDGLRVVDASVFPRNPGAFPVVSTTMVGQKGSEVILEDCNSWGV